MHGELPYGYFSSTTLTAARSGYRPICRWHSCTSEPRHRPLEGAYETHVRAHRAQSSSTPLCQRRNVVMTWWYGNPNRPRSLSARASLHARARPKVVREAPKRPALRAQLRAPLLRHRRWRRRHVAEAISEHGGGFQLSNLRSARGSTTTS
jgi:hypothetical protein